MSRALSLNLLTHSLRLDKWLWPLDAFSSEPLATYSQDSILYEVPVYLVPIVTGTALSAFQGHLGASALYPGYFKKSLGLVSQSEVMARLWQQLIPARQFRVCPNPIMMSESSPPLGHAGWPRTRN